jgi:hypothetical protein
MALTPEQVFTPGAFPTRTYVDRKGDEYEVRLLRYVLADGILPSVSGPSKSGKTVLVQKALGPRSIRVSGSEISSADVLWQLALDRLGQAVERSQSRETSSELSASVGGEGGVSVLGIGRGTAKAEGGLSAGRGESETLRFLPHGMAKCLEQLKARDLVLLIDDFHYVEASVKTKLAQQLKEGLTYGAHVVVLAVPHRGDDPIRANPDLRGRVASIDLGHWSTPDLQQIGQLGFPLLEIPISAESVASLAVEALGSPQLMQALCLEACYYWERAGKPQAFTLGVDGVKAIATGTSAFTDASTPYSILAAGPKRHGTERTQYSLAGGVSGDNYVLILRALAADPPLFTFGYDELLTRIRSVVEGDPPQGQQIGRSLIQMEELLEERLPNDRVLAWDEEKQVLDLVDPYFLFYLRWKVWSRGAA